MRQWTVDAFAAGPFRGNPACVVEPFDAWPDDGLDAGPGGGEQPGRDRLPAEDGRPGPLRPALVHAGAGGSAVRPRDPRQRPRAVRRAGPRGRALRDLRHPVRAAHRRRAGAGYEMDFPASPPSHIATPAGLAEALGVDAARGVGGATIVVAVLESEAAVRALSPDIAALGRISAAATQGRGNVAVVALADAASPYDVVSRFFAPGSGIAEDPATGSLHCILSPMFSGRLGRATLRLPPGLSRPRRRSGMRAPRRAGGPARAGGHGAGGKTAGLTTPAA